MMRIIKLILSTTLFSFTLSNIEIKQVRVSWYDSSKQCYVAGLKTADITEIDNMVPDKNPCRKEDINTQHWIKNDYKLSNMISIEGCFINKELVPSEGRQSLRSCYQKCLQSPIEFSMFAFKNEIGGLNCKCNFNDIHINTNIWNISQCLTSNKPLWKYRIHKSVVETSKEYCRTISCTDNNFNNHFRRDILCGSFLDNPTPYEKIRYVCTENKTLSSTDMPTVFRFMMNSSFAKDIDQSETVFNKCNAIKCLNESTYETIVTDCTSNMSGVICLNDIEIKQVRVSWYDSSKQCYVAGLKTADITEIDNMVPDKNPCRKEDINTQYWIKNDYKLSNMISIEGCFINKELVPSEGRQSLRSCYQKCLQSPIEFSMFAFKNEIGGLNCKCNFNDIHINTNIWNISQCLTSNKPWWKYRIHKSVVETSQEYCRTISCTDNIFNNHFRRDILCGSFLHNSMPDEKLRYVCTDNKTLSSTDMPTVFRFMLNASIARDIDQSETIFNKCNAIKCLNESTYETIVTDCTSNMSGVICLNGTGTNFHMSSTNTPLKSSLTSINVHISHISVNNSPNTPLRTMSTALISTEKNSDASSASRQVPNASTPAFTELAEQITKFATTPGAPDIKSPMTFISSDSHIQLTSYENIIHSTSNEVLNRNINADFPIGLLVGLIVTSLVIAAVVVLLVVCRFKHKGLFRNKKYDKDSHITKFNSPNFNENAKTSDTKTQTVQNSTYAMHTARENENVFSLSDPDLNNMNINNTSNSEYAVVIKNKQMIDNVTNQQQRHDKENLDVIENEYDGLNHNRPDSFTDRTNTTNIYDTALGVRDTSDSTYVTANHVHVVDKDENCVYDHM